MSKSIHQVLVVYTKTASVILSEVLLTIILSSFKVSYAKESKDVVWNLASVRYPTVGKESTLPSCPITLERIRD